LVHANVCVTCRAGRLSRHEQLVGYLLIAPPKGVTYCLANLAGTYAATAYERFFSASPGGRLCSTARG